VDFVSEISQKDHARQAADSNVDFILETFVGRDDINLMESKLFRDHMEVSRVPADPVDALDNHSVEHRFVRRFQELGETDSAD
jgi:hypothetical protein